MRLSDKTSVSMPMKNLISIIGAVAVGVWAYFGVTEKLNNHSTKLLMIEKDLEKVVVFSKVPKRRTRNFCTWPRTKYLNWVPTKNNWKITRWCWEAKR